VVLVKTTQWFTPQYRFDLLGLEPLGANNQSNPYDQRAGKQNYKQWSYEEHAKKSKRTG
jgi:hypothetical protein